MNGRKWRLFSLQTLTPAENMALDEAIFRLKCLLPESVPNTVRFYRWFPSSVSIGKHQDITDEVDLPSCSLKKVEVIRRISGGGAVFHMYEGEITYSVIADMQELHIKSSDELYRRILAALNRALANLHLHADYGQVHCPALFINNKKISGNAQAIAGHISLQHGTILVDYDPELMYSVLKARPNKSRTKMIQSVYAYVTTLKKEANFTNFELLASYLHDGFLQEFNITPTDLEAPSLLPEEQQLANFLSLHRYQLASWTFKQEVHFQEEQVFPLLLKQIFPRESLHNLFNPI
jgi:lipoate-protein ligase A